MTTDLFTNNNTETDFLLRGTLAQGRSDVSGVTPGRFGGIKGTTGAPASGTWVTGTFIFDSAGTMWICTVGGSPGTWVNPAVAGQTAGITQTAVATSETTSSTTYADLATVGPTVTITIPANGLALVTPMCEASQSVVNDYLYMGFTVSGANTAAAADAQAASNPGLVGNAQQMLMPYLLTGLTAGSTTFTSKYRVAFASTGTFARRRLSVQTF